MGPQLGNIGYTEGYTVAGYQSCFAYCAATYPDSAGFFQITSRCHCYNYGCHYNGGTYTFKMNC